MSSNGIKMESQSKGWIRWARNKKESWMLKYELYLCSNRGAGKGEIIGARIRGRIKYFICAIA